MPRSRTGCLTCRQRKLKCSEERPVCSQCQKANRECNPSSGITFRHQQNPSLNSRERGGGALKSFYGYKETFGKGTVWVDVPQQLTFVHTNNPYEDEDDGQSGNQGHNEAGDTTFMTEGSGGYGESSGYDLSQAAFPAYATHGLEALSAVASQDQYSYAPPPAPMSQHDQRPPQQQQDDPSGSPQNANAQQDIDFILNPSSGLPHNPNIDPQLHSETPVPQSTGEQAPPTYPQQQPQSPEHVRTRSYSSSYGRPSLHARKGVFSRRHGRAAIEDAELVFLLRDFSERGGLWMDLFDLDLFFATVVPVLAVRCPLLLYSCAALSAKSLARVDGRKPVLNGQVTEARRSQMEKWSGPPMGVEEWVHKAREYYDLAVSLLRQALAGASRPPTSSLPDDASPQTVASVQGYPLPVTDSDELVAATAILCVYEFLDASGPEWSRHLDGAKSLFDIAKDRMFPLTLQKSPASIAEQATHRLSSRCDTITGHVRPGLSKGRRAIFWNFARQDMLSAFIDNTSTRLDTSDLPMWRNAGLQLTPEGFLCPSNPGHADFDPETAMTDDLIANALIWLLSKLVNFISAGDDVPAALSPSGLGIRQQELLDYWHSLDAQLQAWRDGLPESFTATAIYHPSASVDDDLDAEEHWFPRPLCASSMQSYHFARIQLLHNKPHVSTAAPHAPSSTTLPPLSAHGAGPAATSLAARHASYASILSSSRAHAREIVSISRGRSDEGTRIHSVQPLWTAGMVLGVGGEEPRGETERWRKTILELLRGVEEDMGWASEYRARSLIELWGDEG